MGQQGREALDVARAAGEQHLQLVESGRFAVAAREAGRPLQAVDHRMQGATAEEGRALEPEGRLALSRNAPPDLVSEAGLADAGFAREDDDLPRTPPCDLPPLGGGGQLGLPAHQGRQPLLVRCAEPGLACATPHRPPGANGIPEALHRAAAQVHALEEPAGQRLYFGTDHHLVGFGDGLQARREVGSRPRDGPGVSGPGVALDDDVPRGDSDAAGGRREVAAATRLAAEGLDDLQRRTDRPLGVVLVRARPSEARHDAVAQHLVDVTAEARDHLAAGIVEAAQDVPHLLGIEPRGELGRADEIAEHHGQVAPLPRARGPRPVRACRRHDPEAPNDAAPTRAGRRRSMRGAYHAPAVHPARPATRSASEP
jgi:hypothetical protein